MDTVSKNNTLKNNFSLVTFNETPFKKVDRNRHILDIESKHYDNKRDVFNYNNRISIWDKFGIPIETETERVVRKKPKFIVSNFTAKNELYHWLFDLSQDSASRPIGT
jgi:hypothetical protein